ncbi:hypothetical protein UFOVP129_76 [uncultured Caudovirales phage]|uniref:Uncharacterized protein n=1 Tax=uncultured Caudovirales phage TaxID=2100421 RepID=A0A6J5LEN3_9CAUD|nr:hypothetical protein UFOVP129_76 [uncultured Caudovirales phage]
MKGYTVRSVDTFQCKDWIMNKHYAKRMPPIEYSFGLFNEDNIMEGCVTYGTPVSNSLRNLWGGEFKLMELNRLVVNEGLPKNTLSFFTSTSLNMLPKPLVLVSYADTSKNHHGYIYQATNWIYTGLSIAFKDYYIKGMEHLHNGTIMDMSRGQENRVEWLRNKFGDDLIMIDRPQKHRYFYFIGNKKQVKKMNEMLPYEKQPYPKGDNIRYDASYKPTIQIQLF